MGNGSAAEGHQASLEREYSRFPSCLNRLVRTRMLGGVGRAVSGDRPYPIGRSLQPTLHLNKLKRLDTLFQILFHTRHRNPCVLTVCNQVSVRHDGINRIFTAIFTKKFRSEEHTSEL